MKTWLSLIKRSLREGVTQLWRNKFLSGTTIGLGALVLFLLNFVFAMDFVVEKTLDDLQSRTDFSIPLRDQYDSFEYDALINELENEFTVETQFFSAEKFVDFTLPARLKIQFKDLTEVSPVIETLKKVRYIEVIGAWDQEGEKSFAALVDQMLSVQTTTEKTSLLLTILFLGGGILLAINTFRIVLFSRKDEILIARLVGADPNFIRGPFLVEGIFLGFLSALIAILLFTFTLREIQVLPGAQIFLYLYDEFFAWEILLSGLTGAAGAWIAVQKYLLGSFNQ